ncbi:cyclophilin-like fold protein [Vibrio japonicus]|uniref:Cyclophilin-like fold protein n=1 Tax=Vibrio japonicus TaxID=1824638 RepID=A0ABY5LN05_9VIBR|nr:cyclophilin-like fold protein [Vibrio japonicus]UUM32816.1 cyclophilin-like fold protein [Vibrio japonicus]
MKIRFVFDDRTITATLNDSPSTQDFIAQLPLTVELEDYASTEKIAYLPSKITKEGAPAGVSSKAGDISYYAPWGNLVVFYKNFGYASGLINLGKVDGDLARFTSGGSMKVTIEVIE